MLYVISAAECENQASIQIAVDHLSIFGCEMVNEAVKYRRRRYMLAITHPIWFTRSEALKIGWENETTLSDLKSWSIAAATAYVVVPKVATNVYDWASGRADSGWKATMRALINQA